MKQLIHLLIVTFALATFLFTGVHAQERTTSQATDIVVRAQSKDAKFIGTSMGGALITIENAVTGKLLAKGVTEGSTGDTQKLVGDPKERYSRLSTPGAAKFETSLQLEEPTLVTISATAPYAKKQAWATTSTDVWLIPGKPITGDGIILEIPGFVVDVLSPQTHQTLAESTISIKANIVMMCGCPTSEGGLWDSSDYEIEALIKKEGDIIDTIPLDFTGQTSTYAAEYQATENGVYEIIVTAYHAETGNTGVDKTTVILSE